MATPPMVGFLADHLYDGNVALTQVNHRTSTESVEAGQANGFVFPYTSLHAVFQEIAWELCFVHRRE